MFASTERVPIDGIVAAHNKNLVECRMGDRKERMTDWMNVAPESPWRTISASSKTTNRTCDCNKGNIGLSCHMSHQGKARRRTWDINLVRNAGVQTRMSGDGLKCFENGHAVLSPESTAPMVTSVPLHMSYPNLATCWQRGLVGTTIITTGTLIKFRR